MARQPYRLHSADERPASPQPGKSTDSQGRDEVGISRREQRPHFLGGPDRRFTGNRLGRLDVANVLDQRRRNVSALAPEVSLVPMAGLEPA